MRFFCGWRYIFFFFEQLHCATAFLFCMYRHYAAISPSTRLFRRRYFFVFPEQPSRRFHCTQPFIPLALPLYRHCTATTPSRRWFWCRYHCLCSITLQLFTYYYPHCRTMVRLILLRCYSRFTLTDKLI
ncbi:hypothetical protein DEO72_LG3g1623 [Vigna unguiculata]|uniref:Uncharacterized protein n=1 Tax=Vigna unguiculata TaxID=3917 RepID=A0A4D6KS95_VIGUN|nr:hypothetical protein DEO72_LG1g3212 [Vigna unguiculata]QCD87092.1 hypothetical protein DEO72_LG3g1623 [Vigna unguiculata]